MKTHQLIPSGLVRDTIGAFASKAIRRSLTALTVVGLGGLAVQAQTFTPIPLTPSSFTVNVVVPIDWTYKLNAQSVSVTIDHGPCLQTNTSAAAGGVFAPYYSVISGDTFFEQGMNRAHPTYGLPPSGTLLTSAGFSSHVFQLPNWLNWNSNCVCICPYTNDVTYNSQPLVGGPYTYPTNNPYYGPSLVLNNTQWYTALSLLCSGGGPDTNTVMIQYADGTSQGPVTIVVPNWFVNANTYIPPGTPQPAPTAGYAYTAQCRCNPAENQNNFTISSGVTSGSRLWSIDIALNNTNSYVTNLVFTPLFFQAANGTTHADVIIAVSGSTNTADNATIPSTAVLTGPFNPIPVSGFNAGFVVANSPQTLAGLAPLTATMDNGTNLAGGANTWFEVGWDAAAPTNGFPAHGTTLRSLAFPTRTYQMPTNYHQNMATLVDTNHQLVSITPQTPGSYTAFSLLTCGASIGSGKVMTNYIILQHSDGINESNVFFGYDWFETTVPYAYAAYERVNIGTSGSTTGREVQNLNTTGTSLGVPRIFESEFQMFDGSPVTNIQLGYLVAPAANSATYVIGVSASTDFLPVGQVAGYTPAQNVFAGQSASFSITPGIGSLPAFQWQYTDGATFTNNLPNGPSSVPGSSAVISGATTTNLTIANVGSADAGYLYTCQVYNSEPSSTNSPLAVLSLRVSTVGNIATPGDPITDFGEALASPAGLTLPNVIDNTMATYLNYGGSGSTAGPFVGPVGIILTPSMGSTVVTGLRFVVAINASICDPADFMLEGSNDGGTTYSNIVADTPLSLPVERNLVNSGPVNVTNQVLQEVTFPNSTPYTSYRLTVQNVRNAATANSMQIAEIQFLGAQQLVAPGILTQPGPLTKTLLTGGSYVTTSVRASGPTNYFYHWYSVIGGVTNSIPNATNANLVLNNVQVSQAGSYFVVVNNSYGSTASILLSLTVQSPSPGYSSAIVADQPLAYWRLDEGNGNPPQEATPNGAVMANDYMGRLNGIYTNVFIGEPGYSANDPDTAAGFGGSYATSPDSFVGQVPAFSNFTAPSNSPAEFSVEVWVQNPNFPQAQSIAGAGIVTYGYGGAGEQFALDCGATSNNFRFYFRDATKGTNVSSNPSHTVSAPASGTGDGLWHHVVGVLDSENATNNAAYIYVDGLLVATTPLGTNLLGVQNGGSSLTIGSRAQNATTNQNFQFNGIIDEVALYPYALSSTQVLSHYYAAGIVPFFTLQPTNITVSEGGNAMFATQVRGTPSLALQWYIVPASGGGAVTNALAHQTNATLVLTGVHPDPSGPDTYFLLASNTFGVTASASVQLTVVAGAPQFSLDLAQYYTFVAGYPFTLETMVDGTTPITYGWYYNVSTALQDVGRVSGSHSEVLTVANAQLSDSGSYQLFATNGIGTTPSVLAAVTVVPTLGFNNLGDSWAINGFANYSASNVLTLTTSTGQGSSSFFSFPVYIGSFEASWIYQDIGGAGADGACFVVQNAPAGAAALGGTGGGLGVTGITPSAELEFNIYSGNAYGGVGYAFATNGTLVNVSDPYPLNIASGDPIYVSMKYANGAVSLSMMETNGAGGNNYFSTTIPINLPAAVGGTTAYVGFTGASGGTGSNQEITDFNFVSLPALTAQSPTPGSVVLSWPTDTGAYVLEQSSSVGAPSWTPVGGTVTQVDGMNQQTVSSAGGPNFYRLHLQYTPQ